MTFLATGSLSGGGRAGNIALKAFAPLTVSFISVRLSEGGAGSETLAIASKPALLLPLTALAKPDDKPLPSKLLNDDAHPQAVESGGNYYYAVPELHVRPALVGTYDVPEEVGDRGSLPPNGKAILEVLIGLRGEVQRVSIQESDLPQVYRDTLVKIFYGGRYTPAWKNGTIVRSRLYFEVVYVDGVLNLPTDQVVVSDQLQSVDLPSRPIPRPERKPRAKSW